MKKLFFLFLTAGLFLTQVSHGQSGTWVQTEDGQLICKKVTVQTNTTKVVLDNGEKTTIPTAEISSYAQDDVQYKKMPLITNGASKGIIFMELVKSTDEMNLYRFIEGGSYRYQVYHGDRFYMEVLDGNKSEFEKFFHLDIKI